MSSPTDSTPVVDVTTKKILPWLVAVAFFMESLDTTILNTAVPIIANALGVVPLSMKAVLSSYTLALAVFIPISSWVADRFGTRRVFAGAIGLFTLGSFLCGICTSIHWLVLCRILQGCGGAMMVPVGRLTLVRSFPKSELIRAMSFVGIPALIGPMLGPLAGGAIVSLFHWRVIFFVNIPIGLLGLYLVHLKLPDFRAKRRVPLDWVGMLLFGAGIAIFSYVLEVFGEHTLSSSEVGAMFAMSASLLGAYALHASRVAEPVLKLGMFRIRTLRVSVIGNLITRLGAGGMPFLLPLLYQVGLGYTPVQSGLLIMPQSIAAICFKMTMPKLLSRFGFRSVLLLNTLMLGLSIAAFSRDFGDTSPWFICVEASIFGFLSSLQYTSMNTLVYADVSDGQTSMASTIVSTVQQMSLSFGVAISSLIAAYFVPDRFHSTPDELVHGIHRAFVFMGLMTMGSALGFYGLKPEDGDNVSLHKGANEGAH